VPAMAVPMIVSVATAVGSLVTAEVASGIAKQRMRG